MNDQPLPHRVGAGAPSPSAPGPLTQAVIHAGGVETPYLRGGRGPTLLFLGPDRPCREADADLQALAESFRVIAPLRPPPAGPRDGARWIRDIIDGLGLERPVVVAHAGHEPLLFRVLRRDPERVRLCVLVPSPCPTDPPRPSLEVAADVAAVLRPLVPPDGAT